MHCSWPPRRSSQGPLPTDDDPWALPPDPRAAFPSSGAGVFFCNALPASRTLRLRRMPPFDSLIPGIQELNTEATMRKIMLTATLAALLPVLIAKADEGDKTPAKAPYV